MRACGTMFSTHKVAAMNRVIEQFGAYLAHIISLANDQSVKVMDRQKLFGYARKWCDSKLLLETAMLHDLPEPCATLCRALQDKEVCVIGAIKAFPEASKAIDAIKSIDLHMLSIVEKVHSQIQTREMTQHIKALLFQAFL